MTTGRINQVVVATSARQKNLALCRRHGSRTANRQRPTGSGPLSGPHSQALIQGHRCFSHTHNSQGLGSLRDESIAIRQGAFARITAAISLAGSRLPLDSTAKVFLTLDYTPSLGEWNELDTKLWWPHEEPSAPTVTVERLPTNDARRRR